MFQFGWPWAFGLLCLPLLVWWFFPPRSTTAGAIQLPYFNLVSTGSTEHGSSRLNVSIIIRGLIWTLLVFAIARPQWVGDPVGIPSTGRNLMLAVDVSGSMKTRDMEIAGHTLNRLQVVKLLGDDFLQRRVGDRIGLILFGSQAYLQAPLSFDRKTVATLLDEAEIGIAGERTAIGDAIGLALKRLRLSDATHRVLILLTDGANTAGQVEPAQAARLAKREDMKIYTVGIGADRMQVNSVFGVREVNPAAELDERLLTHIADTTGGQYYRARNSGDLKEIYSLIDEIEPVAQEQQSVREIKEYFYVPLGIAMLLALTVLMLRVIAASGISARIQAATEQSR